MLELQLISRLLGFVSVKRGTVSADRRARSIRRGEDVTI